MCTHSLSWTKNNGFTILNNFHRLFHPRAGSHVAITMILMISSFKHLFSRWWLANQGSSPSTTSRKKHSLCKNSADWPTVTCK